MNNDINASSSLHTETATFGAGCFWCTEVYPLPKQV